MTKLYKNKSVIAILTSISLATFLNACTPTNEKKEEVNKEQESQIIEQEELEKQVEEQNEEKVDEVQESSDEKIEEYINELRKDINELSKYTEEKWQSEEVQKKYSNVKKKVKNLFDFVFNEKEINGITFKELSEEGKQIALNGFYELDSYIEMLIPNYKERLYEKIVDEGADVLEKKDSVKEWIEKYSEDALEEYNSRKTKSK